MFSSGVIALAHDAAKSGHQFGPGAAKFVMMMERQFGEDLLSLGRESEQHFAAVVLGPGAMNETSGFQAIHQFHGAMMADFHASG